MGQFKLEPLRNRKIYVQDTPPLPEFGEDGDIVVVRDSGAAIIQAISGIATAGKSVFWDGARAVWANVLASYYNQGVETVNFAEGTSASTGTQSKETDHLYMMTENASAKAVRIYITDEVQDLTDINKLYVEWENTGADTTLNASSLFISEIKTDTTTYATIYTQITNAFGKMVSELDVSAVDGTRYIGVEARDKSTTSAQKCELKVYRIWGEG